MTHFHSKSLKVKHSAHFTIIFEKWPGTIFPSHSKGNTVTIECNPVISKGSNQFIYAFHVQNYDE
jgi:hypothetical protein